MYFFTFLYNNISRVVAVLSMPNVPLDSTFSDLGGHSLSAAQLLTRVRATFAVDLPLVRILGDPKSGNPATCEQLAALIDHLIRSTGRIPVVQT